MVLLAISPRNFPIYSFIFHLSDFVFFVVSRIILLGEISEEKIAMRTWESSFVAKNSDYLVLYTINIKELLTFPNANWL